MIIFGLEYAKAEMDINCDAGENGNLPIDYFTMQEVILDDSFNFVYGRKALEGFKNNVEVQ